MQFYRLERAFTFGTVVSGKEGAASDIDLLIISEVGFSEVVSALYPVQERLGRRVKPKIYRLEECSLGSGLDMPVLSLISQRYHGAWG